MKKWLLVSGFVVTFILGIVLSEVVIQGINKILGSSISTKKELARDKEEAEKSHQLVKKQYEALSGQVDKKQANLDKLIKEIDTKVDSALVKDILLTTPSSQTGGKGRIFLDPAGTETLLKPTTSDDATVDQFKKVFNKKAKEILDVSKGIMKDKIGQLNKELVRINDEVKDRNVELIGKLREEEKYKKKIGELNNELVSTNNELKEKNVELTVKLQEEEKYKKKIGELNNELVSTNNKLKEKNEELTGKLQEVEKYKGALEERKRYINDLEGIKSDLESTVGVLETKIEKGRLKVSFKGDILFESGRHQLRQEGKQLLESVFPILSKSTGKNDIFIAGHTDNVPIREDARDQYESNWNLSAYRAIEVVKYLMEKGISPQGMTAAGYGEFNPIADNSTDEGKAKNRRVELFIIPRIIKRSL